MNRKPGITTRQMKNAPKGAVFLWRSDDLSYPQQLAKSIGRDDLIIKSKHILTTSYFVGRRVFIIIDHGVDHLTDAELEALRRIGATRGEMK